MPSNASVIKRSQEQEPVGSTDGFFIHEVPEKQRDRLSGRRVLEGSSGKIGNFRCFGGTTVDAPRLSADPTAAQGRSGDGR